MIQTIHYDPVIPTKFWRNMRRRWTEYSDDVAHFNADSSVAQRTNGEYIYHVLNATVFVRKPKEQRMVSVTAHSIDIEPVKSLLEEISKVKLLEKI